jgi:molecular chaperone GrpE
MTAEHDSRAAAGGGDDAAAAGEVEVEVELAADAGCGPADARVAELEARIASLAAQLELAQEKARGTFAQLKDEHERHLRAAADLENYRKRAQREREEVQRFGTERLLKDLLPVVDDLDRALAAAGPDEPLVAGVRLVRRVLEEALARHAVEVFSALGQPFDPRLHEALAQLEAPEAEPGTVVAEHGRGFLLHGRLLRPALVAVAGRRPEAPAPPPGEARGEPAEAPAAAEPAEKGEG